MKTFLVCLAAVLTLALVSDVFAITDEEIFRAFSLNLSTPGARARAMGGAFIGRADDATAAETNPAGLSLLVRPEISLEYGFSNTRTVSNSVINIPVSNFDITPSPVQNPDPNGELDDTLAEFQATDTLDEINQLGFLSVVYPFHGITIAVSRHQLIKTQASVSGGLSSSPFHFVEPNDFVGAADINQANYAFSIAGRIGDYFALGGNIKVADFQFDSNIAARQRAQPFHGEHFTSTISSSDTQVGFTVGMLVRPTSKVSIGAVYRYEPEFELDAFVDNTDFGGSPLIIARTGESTSKMDIPDSVGAGISISPSPNLNINFDVVRVFHSQLENIDVGYSLFTHLLPTFERAGEISFKIEDGTDIHVGAEYLHTAGDWIVAFRGGYYREEPNRFFLAAAANPEIDGFLRPVFGKTPGEDYHHFTAGSGITYGQFQLDFAVDLSPSIQTDKGTIQGIEDGTVDFIVSSVFRF
ncbi:outer membrane protein transport protein [bacterium]|nr:outer membrane protein transport protein [bacterium]